jgi:hypothetical protein
MDIPISIEGEIKAEDTYQRALAPPVVDVKGSRRVPSHDISDCSLGSVDSGYYSGVYGRTFYREYDREWELGKSERDWTPERYREKDLGIDHRDHDDWTSEADREYPRRRRETSYRTTSRLEDDRDRDHFKGREGRLELSLGG